MQPIKVLAIYRGKIFENRGTPIRVQALLSQIERGDAVDLTVCSWDKSSKIFSKHFTLTNNHLDDLRQICRYVRSHKVDAVIGYTTATSYYLAPLKFFTKAKIVFETHGFDEDEAFEYGDISRVGYWRKKLWYAIFYRLCDLIITCSQSPAEILLKYNRRVVSIYDGVDITYFNTQATSGGYIHKDGRIVIGYAGNNRRWQGVDFLIDVYKKLSAQHDNFKLALLMSETKGLGDAKESGAEIVAPLPNHDVPKFLIDCDILVIPRPDTAVTRLSFPSKLMTYLAMGKAVVASCTGDVDKIIIPGVNGLIYTPGDADGLIKCLKSLRDPELRARLGAAAVKTAQVFSWERQSELLIDNIRKII